MISLRSWSPIHAVKNMIYVMDNGSRRKMSPFMYCSVDAGDC